MKHFTLHKRHTRIIDMKLFHKAVGTFADGAIPVKLGFESQVNWSEIFKEWMDNDNRLSVMELVEVFEWFKKRVK